MLLWNNAIKKITIQELELTDGCSGKTDQINWFMGSAIFYVGRHHCAIDENSCWSQISPNARREIHRTFWRPHQVQVIGLYLVKLINSGLVSVYVDLGRACIMWEIRVISNHAPSLREMTQVLVWRAICLYDITSASLYHSVLHAIQERRISNKLGRNRSACVCVGDFKRQRNINTSFSKWEDRYGASMKSCHSATTLSKHSWSSVAKVLDPLVSRNDIWRCYRRVEVPNFKIEKSRS